MTESGTAARLRPLVLVGFMGCGKSTVGRRLADRLNWTFVDTDRWIEEREGRSIEAVFRDSGEALFRRLEAQALAEAARPACVIAAGGGAFQAAASRRHVQQMGRSIWLDITLDQVRRRLGKGSSRPLWDPADPLAQRVLFERRRAVYALAEVRVAVADRSAEELAERIQTEIR